MSTLELDVLAPPSHGNEVKADRFFHLADVMKKEIKTQKNILHRCESNFGPKDHAAELRQDIVRREKVMVLTRELAVLFCTGEVPKFVSGIHKREHVGMLLQIQRDKWPFYESTGFLRAIGVATEDDYNHVLEWIDRTLEYGMET